MNSPKSDRKSSDLISGFERKLIQDIIKPGGAKKRPQESVLLNFSEAAANLEVPLIFSVLYYVLREQGMEPISKLVDSKEIALLH